MIEAFSRAWQTLVQIVRESSQEQYTKDELLNLMMRVLHEEADNATIEHIESMKPTFSS